MEDNKKHKLNPNKGSGVLSISLHCRKNYLNISMLILCIVLSFIIFPSNASAYERSDYVKLLDKDDYIIDNGKWSKPCYDNLCDFTIQLCKPHIGMDHTILLKIKDKAGVLLGINDRAENYSIYVNSSINHGNGTIDKTWQSVSLNQVKTGIDNAPVGKCRDLKVTFNLKGAEGVDIVPNFNNIEYNEYAWFFPFVVSGVGGIYCPFDEYEVCHDCGTGFNDQHIFECKHINTTDTNKIRINVTDGNPLIVTEDNTYLNSSLWSIFVNDTNINPYGALQTRHTSVSVGTHYKIRDYDNIHFLTTSETDYWVGAYFYLNSSSTDIKFISHFLDGSEVLSIYLTNRFVRCQHRHKSSSPSIEHQSDTQLTAFNHYFVACQYNATSNNYEIWINGNLDKTTSGSGIAYTFDGTSGDLFNIGHNNAGGRMFLGAISEFWAVSGVANNPEEMEDIYKMDHISTAIVLQQDITTELVITAIDLNINFSSFDNVDTTFLYYTNDSVNSVIDNDGNFVFNSVTEGTYYITVNVTDNFDNWDTDTFIISVAEGLTIDDKCLDFNIYHDENISCITNATTSENKSITWSVNDTRVTITQDNRSTTLSDNPIITDYNLPECWNISITANDTLQQLSYSLLYCINDTAPVITSNFSNYTSLNVTESINLLASWIDPENASESNIGITNCTFISDVVTDGLINLSINYNSAFIGINYCNYELSDGLFSDTSNTFIIEMQPLPDKALQLTVNRCPADIPGQMLLWLVVFISFVLVFISIIIDVQVFGVLGGIGMLITSWYLVACSSMMGWIIASAGIVIIIWSVIRK